MKNLKNRYKEIEEDIEKLNVEYNNILDYILKIDNKLTFENNHLDNEHFDNVELKEAIVGHTEMLINQKQSLEKSISNLKKELETVKSIYNNKEANIDFLITNLIIKKINESTSNFFKHSFGRDHVVIFLPTDVYKHTVKYDTKYAKDMFDSFLSRFNIIKMSDVFFPVFEIVDYGSNIQLNYTDSSNVEDIPEMSINFNKKKSELSHVTLDLTEDIKEINETLN